MWWWRWGERDSEGDILRAFLDSRASVAIVEERERERERLKRGFGEIGRAHV